jgi:hypothetical protein
MEMTPSDLIGEASRRRKKIWQDEWERSTSPTYLCGTTTIIWLRPDQEDLSMTACLDHRNHIFCLLFIYF